MMNGILIELIREYKIKYGIGRHGKTTYNIQLNEIEKAVEDFVWTKVSSPQTILL